MQIGIRRVQKLGDRQVAPSFAGVCRLQQSLQEVAAARRGLLSLRRPTLLRDIGKSPDNRACQQQCSQDEAPGIAPCKFRKPVPERRRMRLDGAPFKIGTQIVLQIRDSAVPPRRLARQSLHQYAVQVATESASQDRIVSRSADDRTR